MGSIFTIQIMYTFLPSFGTLIKLAKWHPLFYEINELKFFKIGPISIVEPAQKLFIWIWTKEKIICAWTELSAFLSSHLMLWLYIFCRTQSLFFSLNCSKTIFFSFFLSNCFIGLKTFFPFKNCIVWMLFFRTANLSKKDPVQKLYQKFL